MYNINQVHICFDVNKTFDYISQWKNKNDDNFYKKEDFWFQKFYLDKNKT